MRPLPLHPTTLARTRPLRRGAVAVGLLALAAQVPSPAGAQSATVGTEELARCERAVRQALLPNGAAAAAELRFAAAPAVQRQLPDEGRIVLQGEGKWRDAGAVRTFRYSCNIDAQGGDAVGVVIRQLSPAPDAAATAPTVLEPDLSHLSPAACESSAAAALKRRWPQVSQISFDVETRRLTQQSASRAELQGQGRAQASPGSPALVHFGFECTVDPRDGRVVGMRLSG